MDGDGPRGDELGDREMARIRRRDRDAEAQARDLMRPGMGKVFKQIQDAQAKAGREADPDAGASPVGRGSRRKRR